jgi:hypothetical protein
LAGRPLRAADGQRVDSSTVKLPVMMPDPPGMWLWITGAEITWSSSTMAKGADIGGGIVAELARAGGVEAEADRRRAVLVKGGLGVGQFLAAHHGAFLDDVDRCPFPARAAAGCAARGWRPHLSVRP